MKFKSLLTVGALTVSMASSAIAADTNPATPMSDAQKKEIEKVVHDYLVANPEVLLEVSQALQQKQQQNMQQQAQSAIKDNTDQLFQGKTTIVGNPKGNVTIVEFFDYQCIHCKKMSPVIDSLLKKDSDLRVVYKEFPIFGKSSEIASRAALAAGMQGKYQAMHNALISIDKRLNDQIVMATAKSLGLDMKKLKTDMQSKEVTAILDANRELAEKLHLMGTPAFIVASTPNGQFKAGSEPSFIPGAASEESLQELIKKAAGNS
ncbi:DsbA family protein [Legionella longbeachae]|uniref:Putative outer membrane protein n=1 Tax=Legionella longbeachae serogroup 1 (strain NSW150) TaxID=661367 RepID=D3HR81_LEGLN|nr:DsbA family protein [Legionella longbeachae]VEE01919.1 27 kDa outer membrane protein [Legionella oakridgensis]HBD7396830.1 DsbA family protein [Legionella pneumophila]ARB91766.1 DsbA family protein [Legionella longbeachae]ARM35089.1 DsbA family protein [Legionella longbeachae]EEZ95481.1 27 kDa outer membrane protein [Legionella longbeachae D-4968]